MSVTYPPANPTLTGDVYAISRFLNNPTAVQRRIRELAQNRFITDALLAGRYEGSAIAYDQDPGQYTSKPPEIVTPGAQYPRALPTTGPALMAYTSKWGQDVPITDESVGRMRGTIVERTLTQVVNYIVYQIDTISLSVINSSVTNSVTATAAWDAAGAKPLLDILRAKARVRAQNKGYEPNVIAMDDYAHAYLMDNIGVLSQLAGQMGTSIGMQGDLLVVAGLVAMPTPNLPVAGGAFVVDTAQLGGIGFERIPSPEYQGDPAQGVESWIGRNPARNDEYIVRGRRPVVPIVENPAAGCKITGMGTLND
jgi:hypothetical protein